MAENGIIKFEFEGKLLIDNTEDLPVRTGYSGHFQNLSLKKQKM